MKRFIILFITATLLLSLIIIPSFAAEYGLLDYNDYITSTEFDGTNDNVVVKFPESMCSSDLWRYYPAPTTRIGIVNSSSATWTLENGKKYYADAFPMGYSSATAANNNRLKLDNIPDGTQIHFDLTYGYLYTDDETGLIDSPSYDAWVIYYSDTGVISSQQYTAGTGPDSGYPYDQDTWSFDITINKPAGAKSILFYAQLDAINCFETGRLTFTLENFSLKFSVSALYRLQEQTGKNSAVLNDIQSTLEDQGQTIDEFVSEQQQTNEKLDDIINGEVEPSKPPYSSLVDDLSDLESGVLRDIEENLDFIDDSFDSAFDAFVSYNQSILGAAFIFNSFADIGLFGSLLYVSLSLGVVASIFGVAASVLSKSGSGKAGSGKSGSGDSKGGKK